MNRRKTALLAAAGLLAGGAGVGALAAPAMAQSCNGSQTTCQQTGNISGTATINETLTLALSATSFALAAGNVGAAVTDGSTIGGTVSGPTISGNPVNATVSTNDGAGYQLTLATNTDFTSGTHNFPAADVSVLDEENPYGKPPGNGALDLFTPLPAAGGTAVQLANSTNVANGAVTPLAFQIFASAPDGIPVYAGGLPNVPGGTYTATFTATALGN